MLKKIVRGVSRGRERPPSPEFVSRDALMTEARRRSSSTHADDRPSVVRDVQLAVPGQPHAVTPGGSAVVPIYLDTSLEALNLEPIIGATLGPMRPRIREAEANLTPLPPLPPHSRKGSLTVPSAAHLAPPSGIRRQPVALQPPPTVRISPPDNPSNASSSSSETNPFELEFGQVSPTITPMPKRPPMQRKAASYRTQRELPLRVQAVRRSHQEMYARQILAQSTLRRDAMARRASETEVPRRAPPMSPTSQARAQSVVQLQAPARPGMRSRSSSRDGSRMRHERLPSGPHRARRPSPEETDFYLLAAMSSWSFDP